MEEKDFFEQTPEGEEKSEAVDNDSSSAKENEDEKAEFAFRWDYEEKRNTYDAPKTKKQGRGLLIYAVVATAAFICCFGVLAVALFSGDLFDIYVQKSIERTIYVREYDSESGVLTIPEIAGRVKPSVVGIEVTTESGIGVGTGIIMSEDGYIATNAHVVQNAASVDVIMLDGTELEAKIIGRDELNDLAVIKVEGADFPAAEFGKSEELIVGELAVAIGTPAGLDLAGTVTSGIISAINRNVKIYDESTGALKKTMTLIQTSANINRGNSGGPLINERGQVIGINTLKLADGYDGIGFAIPIDGALSILNRIIETGADVADNNTEIAKKRVVIGIKGGAVSKTQGYPVDGIYVSEITEGYDAQNHLQVGDIIIGVDGNEVFSVNDVSDIINEKSAGESVTLKIYRNKMIFDVDVILAYE